MKNINIKEKFKNIFFSITQDKRKKILTLFIFAIIFSSVITVYYIFDFPYLRIKFSSLEVGMISDIDIVAKNDFDYTDKIATANKISNAQQLIKPFYYINNDINNSVLKSYQKFSKILKDNLEKKRGFEKFYFDIQSELNLKFDRDILYSIYRNSDILMILDFSEKVLNQILYRGIVNINTETLPESLDTVILCKLNSKNQIINEEIGIKNLVTIDNLKLNIKNELNKRGVATANIDTVINLLMFFVKENTFYNAKETTAAKNNLELELEPVKIKVKKGDILIKKGYPISKEQIEVVRYLKSGSKSLGLKNFFGVVIFIFIILFLSYFIFDKYFIKIDINHSQIIIILSLSLFLIIIYMVLKSGIYIPENIPLGLFIPSGLVAIVVSVLATPPTAVFLIIFVVLTFQLFFNIDSFSLLFILSSGIIGALGSIKIFSRRDILKGGLFLVVMQIVLVLAVSLLRDYSFGLIFKLFFFSLVNGFLSTFVALGLIPLLEYLFNLPTLFRLLEITDINAKIFLDMLEKVPGTYAHTLDVACLAENAAISIGADSLLAKAGAMYHDIGKMDNSEYFAENIKDDISKHLNILPKMSANIIKNHVAAGVKKANELKLPKSVVNIIDQHHGNGVVTYFYIQALKNNRVMPTEEDYSYNSPIPKSKEAAIVMLADIAEAASRSMQNPSLSSLERFITKIINDKIEKRQLDESKLTFDEVNIIKNAFMKIFSAKIHSRPQYPGQEDEHSENK